MSFLNQDGDEYPPTIDELEEAESDAERRGIEIGMEDMKAFVVGTLSDYAGCVVARRKRARAYLAGIKKAIKIVREDL